MSQQELNLQCINTIRMLSADAIEKAGSGHPGLPMGAAPMAYTLWDRFLKFSPSNPDWTNRDRFVLSAGHGSMLQYSLLHLTGYDLPLEDIKNFRQWGSKAAGHPEHGLAPGVETTTGPLGQGFATAIGMAVAEKILANKYNRPDHEIIDYYTYAIVSDGDLMEGVSAEAASYAGELKLGKAVFLYDDNDISIEGSTDITFREDVAKRFDAYGWHTVKVADGNNTEEIAAAIEVARADERPSLILVKTIIGFGSPNKQGTSAAHGSPLGEEELKVTKENLGWPTDNPFFIPDEVLSHMRRHSDEGASNESRWDAEFADYKEAYPEQAEELLSAISGKLPDGWDANMPVYTTEDKPMATREASGQMMNAVAPNLPLFIGGSADLGPSNNTNLNDFGSITVQKWDDNPRNLHFGVREHAMGAISNGMALSGLMPYAATFFIFSDFMRGSMRLSALMGLPVTYILTHDSIGQGEDGATHQPVEHLASLRAMPGMTVIRPSDATETVEAWRYALRNRDRPVSLVFTRQKLATVDRAKYATADNLQKGAYVLSDCEGDPDITLMASGSEVQLVLDASEQLAKSGHKVRVVSFPSWEIFDEQDDEYKQSVFSSTGKRMSVEAGSSVGWHKYVGIDGSTLCIDTFGASAPGPVMMDKYGFTVDNVVDRALKLLG